MISYRFLFLGHYRVIGLVFESSLLQSSKATTAPFPGYVSGRSRDATLLCLADGDAIAHNLTAYRLSEHRSRNSLANRERAAS